MCPMRERFDLISPTPSLSSLPLPLPLSLSLQVMDLEMSRDGSILTVTAGREVQFLDAATLDCLKTHTLERGVEGKPACDL